MRGSEKTCVSPFAAVVLDGAPGAPGRLRMSKKRLDAEWTGWLRQNMERGCNREELLGILLGNAFDIGSIRSAMGEEFPANSPVALAAEGRSADPPDLETIARPRMTQGASGAVRFDHPAIQLYCLRDFLSAAECDGIVAVANPHLRPSTVTIEPDDRYFRTSRTCDLSLVDSPVVRALDDKIARTLGISMAYSEGIQAQRYDVGEEFKAHTDYFEPGTPEYDKFAGALGNRTWTFMVYLNDVEGGGATHFVALSHSFMPEKGMALAWNNLRTDGTVNTDTLHAGTPVTAGHKIIITKWFRERGRGAMPYGR